MPEWVCALIVGFAAGWFRGRLKQVSDRFGELADAREQAIHWRRAYEMQRDAPFKPTTTPVE